MRFALVNSVILNGGDAGIVYGTCDAIRSLEPSAEVLVFAHRATAAAKYYPDLDVRPMVLDGWPQSRLPRALFRKSYAQRQALGLGTAAERRFVADIRRCDAVVYCGGGYLNDSYDMTFVSDLMRVTLGSGVPHMAYAHSVGPINKPETVAQLRQLLNRFAIVTVRDEASRALLQQIGVEWQRVELLADAALAMRTVDSGSVPAGDAAAMSAIQDFKRSGASPLVFISVRSWRFPGHPDSAYRTHRLHEQLVELVRALLTQTDWSICFVSTCQGRPEYVYDDSLVAQRIVDDLGASTPRVMVSRHGFAPRTFPYLIGSCADVVISMRMHLTIYSLLAGVPFVAIAYEQKSVQLCRALGIEQYCEEAADFTAASLVPKAVELHARRADIRAALERKRAELIPLSLHNGALLMERCIEPGRRDRAAT
jgi:colanic acid/amylovoran biosynthesis protein